MRKKVLKQTKEKKNKISSYAKSFARKKMKLMELESIHGGLEDDRGLTGTLDRGSDF